ncbi:5-oxoprolinase subunit PxpA [Paenibacillus sp. PR3]|uniref:5-oxoprolinase subunit A n=1 Tax=Paenibacillus terricola TaxID=2763503 RepID=A0ABR8MYK7_9BACL|nr:5-oxoprolinase subunit PxpA [Paenibacillus terricola]MBD3920121.1 5-oxoprolinase subunit PxpA [Paenibacillus terricola]
MTSFTVDLNADFGEGFGAYAFGQDETLLPYVTSVNIACGWHAGDPHTMREAVARSIAAGVQIGAHPGLPDRLGFGRREMAISPQEAYDYTLYQVGALQAFVHAAGGLLAHVKPHGALYHMANNSIDIAAAIARAVHSLDRRLLLYGQSGSLLLTAGRAQGLRVVSETFADRTYQPDGTLTPRSKPNALLDDTESAIWQAKRMVCNSAAMTADGGETSVVADTICLHGDGPHAAHWAKAIREALEAANIRIQPPTF